MGAKAQVLTGRIKEAAVVLTGNDKLHAQGEADEAIGKATIATQKAISKVAKAARKTVNKTKPAQLLILLSTIIATTMLCQSIGLAQGNRGGRGGERAGASGGRASGGRENLGNKSPTQTGSGAAHQDAGVVHNGVGAQNQPPGSTLARTQPTFIRNNFSSEHLNGSAAGLGTSVNRNSTTFSRNAPQIAAGAPNTTSRSVTAYRPDQSVNTNNVLLHNQQLSGSHWNGGWNNNHNNSYWANRSYFFGAGSPFGYGNGSYAYRSPYAFGLGGLGYGYGGYGLGGYGLGDYGLGGYGLGYGLGGIGLGGYGPGGYGYGGYPTYGYYGGGDNVYAVASAQDAVAPDPAVNVDPAVVQASSAEQPADDALDFAGHGELDFKAGRYDGAVRNWNMRSSTTPTTAPLSSCWRRDCSPSDSTHKRPVLRRWRCRCCRRKNGVP